MTNPFYTPSGNPATGAAGLSALIRSEFTAIETGFGLVGRITTTGLFTTTFNQLGNYTFTLPSVSGTTLATTANVATETSRATAAEGVNTTAIATEVTNRTTAVNNEAATRAAADALLAPKASPALTGTPTAPTAAPGTNSTQLATTAYSTAAIAVETARAVAAEAAKQASLGYTPVQQGTGVGQGSNTVKIGWTGTKVAVTIDVSDLGAMALESYVSATYAALAGATFSGGISATSVTATVGGSGYTQVSPGDATHTGYCAFFNAAGTRQGYIGFAAAGGQINLFNEGTATGYTLNGILVVGGATTLSSTLLVSGAATCSSSLNVNGAMGVLGLAGFSGSIAVSTTSTGTPLAIFSLNNGATLGSISTNGSVTAYNTTSDYRLKITFGRWSQGDAFDRVTVHAAQFTRQKAPPYAMFLAHELQDAGFGYAVTGAKDAVDFRGEIAPQVVDHSLLVPALWAMVQDLRGRLARLEARA